jgi:hypothetical protein
MRLSPPHACMDAAPPVLWATGDSRQPVHQLLEVTAQQLPQSHQLVCVTLGVCDSCHGALADQDDESPSHRSPAHLCLFRL